MSEEKSLEQSHADRSHATFGGSTAHRWSNCYGSVALIKSVPPTAPGEAALWGTSVHEIAARALKDFLDFKTTGEPSDPDWEKDYTDEEAIELAKGYVECIWKDVLQQSLTGKAWGIEEEVCLDEHLDMWGIVDFWCIYIDDRGKKVLAIVDLKTGYHFVEIKKNAQFLFYGCAMIEEIKKGGKNLDILRTCVYQPRLSHGAAFRENSYSSKQTDKATQRFFSAARAISEGKQKLKVGDWCQFCPAQAVCKAYAKSISDRSALTLLDPATIKFPVPESLSEDTLVKLLEHGDEIEDYLKAVKLYAIAKCKNGGGIKGFKIVNGPTKRCWIEDEKSVAATLTSLGIKEPFRPKLITITAAEKFVKKEQLRDIVTTTTPSIILVPDTDPRPSVASAVELLK